MKLKTGLLTGCVLLSGAGFIAADYFALFGVSEKTELTLHEVRFRPIDEVTNSPIVGAKIRCYQQGRKKDVCFQRDSGKLGVVSIMLPRSRISRNSLLFEQAHHFSSNSSTKVHIMLMHIDYSNQIESYDANDLFNNKKKFYRIMMKRQYYDEADNEQV